MAGSASSVSINTVYSSWNGVQLGLTTGASYTLSLSEVPIRNENKIGFGFRPVNMADLTVTLTHLIAPPIDPLLNKCTPADLVIRVSNGCGVNRDITFTGMLPRGVSYAIDRENPPQVYVQQFVHQGDLDSLPITNP